MGKYATNIKEMARNREQVAKERDELKDKLEKAEATIEELIRDSCKKDEQIAQLKSDLENATERIIGLEMMEAPAPDTLEQTES